VRKRRKGKREVEREGKKGKWEKEMEKNSCLEFSGEKNKR
jgi:hypothetical protein